MSAYFAINLSAYFVIDLSAYFVIIQEPISLPQLRFQSAKTLQVYLDDAFLLSQECPNPSSIDRRQPSIVWYAQSAIPRSSNSLAICLFECPATRCRCMGRDYGVEVGSISHARGTAGEEVREDTSLLAMYYPSRRPHSQMMRKSQHD